MQSTCEYNYPRYIIVLVKRFYDDFMDEYHGIFLSVNLIVFPGTEMKTNDQKNRIPDVMKILAILSLVDNFVRIFEFSILSSTHNPKYHYTYE